MTLLMPVLDLMELFLHDTGDKFERLFQPVDALLHMFAVTDAALR